MSHFKGFPKRTFYEPRLDYYSMHATLIDEIIKAIRDEVSELDKIRIEEVCIGLGYTGVLLDTGHLGVAATLLGEMSIDCCEVLERAGELAGSSAEELMMLARSWDCLLYTSPSPRDRG